ncbi:MAG: AAA family ATPase [Nannocystaceae bacterium]
MIQEASFRNFKALADVRVRFGEVTCLVGANASGKTSVLEGIERLTALATSGASDEASRFGGISRSFRGRFEPDLIRTAGSSDLLEFRLEARGTLCLSIALHPRAWMPSASLTGPDGTYRFEVPGEGNMNESFFHAVGSMGLEPSMRLRFEPHHLGRPSYFIDDNPHVAPDGSGLSSVISYLLSARHPGVGAIEDDLNRILPGAGRLRTKIAEISQTEHDLIRINDEVFDRPIERKILGHRLELLGRGGEGIPADHLSEGTLLVIGILTVLHTNPGLKLLLLDDIDRGLHPRAQRTLVELLLKIRAERPELQVVCTTHSPFVLDLFATEDVRVMKRDAEGLAHCQELTAHPEWPKWKETLKAGEFWSFVGEDWVG